MSIDTRSLLVAAAITGIISAAVVNQNANAASAVGDSGKAKAESGKCLGANGCKAKSDCSTPQNACAGMNSCKGKGWLRMTQDECKKKFSHAKWEKLEG